MYRYPSGHCSLTICPLHGYLQTREKAKRQDLFREHLQGNTFKPCRSRTKESQASVAVGPLGTKSACRPGCISCSCKCTQRFPAVLIRTSFCRKSAQRFLQGSGQAAPRVCLFSLFVPALSRTFQVLNIFCLFLTSFCSRLSVPDLCLTCIRHPLSHPASRDACPQKNATTLRQELHPVTSCGVLLPLWRLPMQGKCWLRQPWDKFLQGPYAFSVAGRALSLSMSTSSLPALKKGRRLGGTQMLSPVLGLRP